jgi:hypothetical protein
LPFYATGLAILAAPFLSPLIESINVKKKAFRLFRYITIFLLFAVFAFSVLKIGKTRKDRDNLHDIYLAGNYIGHHETISISPGIEEQWSIYAYFVRHFNISLDPVNHDLEYYLMGEKETFPIPGNYMKTGLPLKKFILLRKVIQ